MSEIDPLSTDPLLTPKTDPLLTRSFSIEEVPMSNGNLINTEALEGLKGDYVIFIDTNGGYNPRVYYGIYLDIHVSLSDYVDNLLYLENMVYFDGIPGGTKEEVLRHTVMILYKMDSREEFVIPEGCVPFEPLSTNYSIYRVRPEAVEINDSRIMPML